MDFAVPAYLIEKIKEREKKDKSLDLTRKLRKLWNMRVTVISTVCGGLGMSHQGLEGGLEELEIKRIATIHKDVQRRGVRLEHTYISSVLIVDVALRTCQKEWTIGKGGERGSEISV